MLLCYVIDSGLSTSLLLLATLIIMFYITFTFYNGHMVIDAIFCAAAADKDVCCRVLLRLSVNFSTVSG